MSAKSPSYVRHLVQRATGGVQNRAAPRCSEQPASRGHQSQRFFSSGSARPEPVVPSWKRQSLLKKYDNAKRTPNDGAMAAAYVAYAWSDQAFIYPITPATAMGDCVANWAGAGRKNLFGEICEVTQMQSEAGAAGACHGVVEVGLFCLCCMGLGVGFPGAVWRGGFVVVHGRGFSRNRPVVVHGRGFPLPLKTISTTSSQVGSCVTTFTSSQGLLLMVPTMYILAGALNPCTFHVAARAITKHALCIFGDQTDVMATRQTGFALLCGNNVQQAMDMALVGAGSDCVKEG